MRTEQLDSIPAGKKFICAKHIEYRSKHITSKTVLYAHGGSVTLFAFDKGMSDSGMNSLHDVLIQIVEGSAQIVFDDNQFMLHKDESFILPADYSHTIYAPDRFKMIVTILR